jgi:hypothetical protein
MASSSTRLIQATSSTRRSSSVACVGPVVTTCSAGQGALGGCLIQGPQTATKPGLATSPFAKLTPGMCSPSSGEVCYHLSAPAATAPMPIAAVRAGGASGANEYLPGWLVTPDRWPRIAYHARTKPLSQWLCRGSICRAKQGVGVQQCDLTRPRKPLQPKSTSL